MAILRRLWPSSLYSQILLVAALALLLAQIINASILFAGLQSRSNAEAATMLVGRLTNHVERQAERGLAIDEEARRQRDQSGHLRNNIPVMVDTAPLSPPGYKELDGLTARAKDYMGQTELVSDTVSLSAGPISALPPVLINTLQRGKHVSRLRQMKQQVPDRAILLSVKTNDGKWVHAAGLIRPGEAGAIWAVILQTITLYIAVMIPLALIARRIVKPLERLKRRVQRVGIADEIEPLESEGPSDVRQLIDSFNKMQSRVTGLLNEKDVMLGAIGHDLKTPLAGLRVRIESVEDEAEREKMASTVDEMVIILDEILMLARLGKSGESSQKTDLFSLVESVIGDFADSGADVTLAESGARIVANLRPVLIRRALRNIIGNALHYGSKANVSVEQHDMMAHIIIDDNGPGISPENIELMFEPFTRAEISRNRGTGGSGLGLTIARAIVRDHGGDIKLSNLAGSGLRAVVELKLD